MVFFSLPKSIVSTLYQDSFMAKICAICGKTPQTGNTRSHANNKSRRRFLPNLQSVRAVIDGRNRRVRVCASCIRAGKVTKVPVA
jgi:large subunit ribosomal protein L28